MKSRTILGLALAPMLLAAWSAHAQQSAEQLLQSGLYKEQVEGDLSSAIGIYESIIANFPDERSVAAKALVQLGQCHEKLGSIEARRAYERVLNDYVDQREQARFARARLAALTPENLAASGVLARQVWAGPEVDIFGAPSPDGRYLSFVDWNTGDLAIRDLSSGKSQHLTHKGSWSESTAYAEFSVVSPNGKQLAYTWFGEDQVHDLRVVGVNGSEPRVLLRNEEVHIVSPAAWSTDGKNILVLLTRKDRTNQIAIISVADGLLRVLKTLDWRQPQKMSLSPDGRYIAYDFPPDEESEQRDIFLLAADGTLPFSLVNVANGR